MYTTLRIHNPSSYNDQRILPARQSNCHQTSLARKDVYYRNNPARANQDVQDEQHELVPEATGSSARWLETFSGDTVLQTTHIRGYFCKYTLIANVNVDIFYFSGL